MKDKEQNARQNVSFQQPITVYSAQVSFVDSNIKPLIDIPASWRTYL